MTGITNYRSIDSSKTWAFWQTLRSGARCVLAAQTGRSSFRTLPPRPAHAVEVLTICQPGITRHSQLIKFFLYMPMPTANDASFAVYNFFHGWSSLIFAGGGPEPG